jgi:hypothetical protein
MTTIMMKTMCSGQANLRVAQGSGVKPSTAVRKHAGLAKYKVTLSKLSVSPMHMIVPSLFIQIHTRGKGAL